MTSFQNFVPRFWGKSHSCRNKPCRLFSVLSIERYLHFLHVEIMFETNTTGIQKIIKVLRKMLKIEHVPKGKSHSGRNIVSTTFQVLSIEKELNSTHATSKIQEIPPSNSEIIIFQKLCDYFLKKHRAKVPAVGILSLQSSRYCQWKENLILHMLHPRYKQSPLQTCKKRFLKLFQLFYRTVLKKRVYILLRPVLLFHKEKQFDVYVSKNNNVKQTHISFD